MRSDFLGYFRYTWFCIERLVGIYLECKIEKLATTREDSDISAGKQRDVQTLMTEKYNRLVSAPVTYFLSLGEISNPESTPLPKASGA